MKREYVRKSIDVDAKRAALEPFKERLSRVYDIGVNVTGPLVHSVCEPLELDKCDPQRSLLNAIMAVKLLTDICLELPTSYKEEVEWEWTYTDDVASEPPKTMTLEEIEEAKRQAQLAEF